MTTKELKERFPNASRSFLEQNADDYRINPRLQDAKPQPDKENALVSAIQGEKEGVGKIEVSYLLYRIKSLDPDNAVGSTKDLTDGLRKAGFIPGDETFRIRLTVEQEKAKSFKEEKTVIRITYP